MLSRLLFLVAIVIVIGLTCAPLTLMHLYAKADETSFLSISFGSSTEDTFVEPTTDDQGFVDETPTETPTGVPAQGSDDTIDDTSVGPTLDGTVSCDPNAATVSRGDQGNMVTTLQNSLLALGYSLPQFGADGDFGSETEAAVIQFQTDNGLAVDGVVGPNIWAKICELLSTSGGTPPPPVQMAQPQGGSTSGDTGGQQGALTVSDLGLEFIKRHEGVVKNLYNDPANHCTIGVGHLVHKGPCDGSEPESFKDGLTDTEVTDLLRGDVSASADAVTRLVTVPLSQQQFDALVSFVFNLGEGNFGSSTLLSELNKGQYDKVPQELKRWVYAGGKIMPGLETRRADEGNLFANGIY